MPEYGDPIGQVTESSPTTIRIEISDPKVFENNKRQLGIGQYLLRAVMIGDDHINAKLVRARYLLHGGNAVVDRDTERHTLFF